MPSNKNQHYVPQFYFRLFSKNGSHIETYNLKRQKSFTAPIKHLCSRDYFYSKKPTIENTLDDLEAKQAIIIKKIIQKSDLRIPAEEYMYLLSFILLQKSRTKSSLNIANQQIEKMSEFILGPRSDYKLVFPKPHSFTMLSALKALPLLHDMLPVMLVNSTQTNFIFSDNPIVFHNMYFNKKENGSFRYLFFGSTNFLSPKR